jgi:DHA1 family multidrug resistance protein-like MFS transporter
VVTFLLALGFSMAQPYTPLLVEAIYRGPRADLAPVIGAVLTFAGIAMAISTPFWGHFGDQVGHLRILRFCGIVVGVTLAGQAMAVAVWQIAALRGAQGLFLGGIGALIMVLLAEYSPRDKRSSILTLSLLPQQLSWFLGPLAGAALAGISLRAVFWVGAGALLAGVLVSARLPSLPPPAEETELLSERALG